MTNFRRLLAFLLVFAMVLSLAVPVMAYQPDQQLNERPVVEIVLPPELLEILNEKEVEMILAQLKDMLIEADAAAREGRPAPRRWHSVSFYRTALVGTSVPGTHFFLGNINGQPWSGTLSLQAARHVRFQYNTQGRPINETLHLTYSGTVHPL